MEETTAQRLGTIVGEAMAPAVRELMAKAWEEGFAAQRNVPTPSADNEPPIGTWVRDRFGGTTLRRKGGGWGQPGMMALGRWGAMWEARGPYTLCGPWGADLSVTTNPYRQED